MGVKGKNELGLVVLTTSAINVLESAQEVTADWANIGGELDVEGFNKIGVFADLTINDSAGVQMRGMAKYTDGGEVYEIPNVFGSSGDYTFADADQKLLLTYTTNMITPFIQLQIKAETVGASPATFNSLYINKGQA